MAVQPWPYASLNLGLSRPTRCLVREPNRKFSQSFGYDATQLVAAQQVHGAQTIVD
jgi:copper oxidase (laccase) domain-containing protein